MRIKKPEVSEGERKILRSVWYIYTAAYVLTFDLQGTVLTIQTFFSAFALICRALSE